MLDLANTSENRNEDEAGTRRLPTGRDFLDTAELERLTPAELARRTATLRSMIAEKAAEAERLRRPVAEVWSALRSSGYFYQFVPRSYGGLGSDLDGFIDATLPIAQACPSTGWTASFCAGHNRTLAHFSAQTQAELWGGRFPYLVAPNLGAPPGQAFRVDGGYRVTGRWSWASGIMDADWVFAVTLLKEGDGPPQMMMVLFPAAEAEVIDTWHVEGLAGSGSNDVRVEELFVPEHHTLRDMGLLSGRTTEGRRHPEPIFQAPMISFAGFVAAVPVLGAAQGALAHFRAGLAGRVEKGTNTRLAESPLKHARLAEADLMLTTAEMLIRMVGRGVIVAGQAEGAEQVRIRVALRAQVTFAVRLCRDAVLHLAEGAGSSVHRLSDPFQRHMRDVAVMASHVGFDVDQAYELHGRTLVGLEPNTMLY